MIKILVIGELCQDIFIYGDANRLSPEAPVPVFNTKFIKHNDGMAGNVVKNLQSMGRGSVHVQFEHQEQTITKTRYIDNKSNHMFIRIDDGEDNVDKFKLDDSDLDWYNHFNAIVVSDYNKGFLSKDDLIKIGQLKPFKIIDTKKTFLDNILSSYDFIKMNEHEFKNNEHILQNSLEKIIITLGINGAMHNNIKYPSPFPKETIDVSGAGDTFLSAFTLNYLKSISIEKSIIFANKMSSIVVSKRGVITP